MCVCVSFVYRLTTSKHFFFNFPLHFLSMHHLFSLSTSYLPFCISGRSSSNRIRRKFQCCLLSATPPIATPPPDSCRRRFWIKWSFPLPVLTFLSCMPSPPTSCGSSCLSRWACYVGVELVRRKCEK